MAILNSYKNFIPAFALMSASLTSCYSDFMPEIDSEPVLCLNSVIEAGKPIDMEITHSKSYTKDDYFWFEEVKDVKLTLFVNGEKKEEIFYREPDFLNGSNVRGYVSEYIPEPGDILDFKAVSTIYGTAEVSVRIPEEVRIENVGNRITDASLVENAPLPTVRFNDNFTVIFTDPSSEKNYYRLLAEPVDSAPDPSGIPANNYSQLIFKYIKTDHDPLFSEQSSVLDIVMGGEDEWFTLFSDRQIQGKRYPLDVYLDDARIECRNPDRTEGVYDVRLRFRLLNVSESYYNWFMYDWQNLDGVNGQLGSLGFAETMTGYSNVSTKAGVVAAFTASQFDVSYSELMKSFGL